MVKVEKHDWKGYKAMKKLTAFVILLMMLFSVSYAEEVSLPTMSGYDPVITNKFCENQADVYGYWTDTPENRALLAILLTQDLMRQDYLAYNSSFPYANMSCVLYHSGKRKDQSICVVYYCADALMAITYNAEMQTAFYSIDRTISDWDQFTNYVTKQNDGWFSGVYSVFETDAFSSAISKWNRYLETHPYLIVIPEV